MDSTHYGPIVDSGANRTILAGEIALIGGALAFLGVFAYLAASFNYPEILDGRAQDVLPALLATLPPKAIALCSRQYSMD